MRGCSVREKHLSSAKRDSLQNTPRPTSETLYRGHLPSDPVSLATTGADQHDLVIAILTFEGDVKSIFVLTLVTDVKFSIDLSLGYSIHN